MTPVSNTAIPRKIALNLEYSARASLGSDIKLIFATVIAVVAGGDDGTGAIR